MSELRDAQINDAALASITSLFSNPDFAAYASGVAYRSGNDQRTFELVYKIAARSIKAAFDEIRAS